MYTKLSFERCVCFIFLVILAFLSCSGFRIDRLATMSDINKRNSFTSTSLSSNSNDSPLSRILAAESDHYYPIQNSPAEHHPYYRPQTRHLRSRHPRNRGLRKSRPSSKAQASQELLSPPPTGRIDTYVIPPMDGPMQIPSPSEPTTSLVSRWQRSPDRTRTQQQQQALARGGRPSHCQRQDVARKAYLANTVVRAKAESMSSNRVHNYSVTFRILERYKTILPIDDTLRLTFSSETKDMNCEIEGHGRPHDLVKAQIQQSKEYFLFLNSHGMHNYSVVGMPVLIKKRKNNKKNRDLDDIRKITSKGFAARQKPPKIKTNRTVELKPEEKLRLVCNARGFPKPLLYWKKDGKVLHSNNKTRITYKKRKMTLIINNVQMGDEGIYQCVSKGVDGKMEHEEVRVQISDTRVQISNDGNECKNEQVKQNYCLNGGTCLDFDSLKEVGCQCPDGFTGKRCEEKDVSNHSSMYGHNTFSCKLGLSTTYYC